MDKKEIFDLIEYELDTDYEISQFLDSVFKKFAVQVLDANTKLLDDYEFMGSEWQAINKCQSEMLKLLPKDLVDIDKSKYF